MKALNLLSSLNLCLLVLFSWNELEIHASPLQKQDNFHGSLILGKNIKNPSLLKKPSNDNGCFAVNRIRGGACVSSVSNVYPTSREVVLNVKNGGQQGEQKKSLIPIKLSEFPQFMAISTLMFLFIYIFTTVRDTKDSLVVSNCGAEAIPFLKLYAVMPSAALFIIGYSKLSNMVGKQALFYLTLIPFFIFYTVFAFVLYPLRDSLHTFQGFGAVASQGSFFGKFMTLLSSLLKYWSFSLYFIVSELWASAGVPLLFWSVANDVTPLAQAKRFYPLFAVFGNTAPIVSGKVMSYIVNKQETNDDVAFGKTLQALSSIKLGVLGGIILLYNLVHSMANKQQASSSKAIEKPKKKKNLPLSQSLKELSKSVELKSIATMVICYNICIETTEVAWKGLLRKQYPNKSDYMKYMANFSQMVGSIAFMLQLLAPVIIGVLGWTGASLITPVSMSALAIPFFFLISQGDKFNIPITTVLTIGTIQNVISKVTKYTLFDPCKELAYIPLGPEAKVKGKAGVEIFGARFGRSIGSASQQLLVLAVSSGGSILECAPSLGVLYVTTATMWGRAVTTLGKLFKTHENEETKKGQK